jgi:hypothetical protein
VRTRYNGVESGGAVTAEAVAEVLGDALSGEGVADGVREILGVEGDPGLPTSGLVALWRASDLALSDGDPVSTWAPSVGTPGSLTGSGSARPTFRATGSPSGGPCVEFDGSNDELSLSSPVGLPSGAAAGTMVAIVARAVGGSGLRHVVQIGNVGSLTGRGLVTSDGVWATHEWSSPMVAGSDSPRTRGAHVLGHVYDGTTMTLWVDGAPAAALTVTLATGTGEIAVGSRTAPHAERGAFRLMALAIYSRALTDADWAQVMAHARAVHGVQ